MKVGNLDFSAVFGEVSNFSTTELFTVCYFSLCFFYYSAYFILTLLMLLFKVFQISVFGWPCKLC